MHEVLRNVLAMFQGDIRRQGAGGDIQPGARRHYVWADAGRFQQILLNLVSNAVKFTPADGSVAVRSSDEESSIRIEIIDSGIGIEPDVLPRLFQPFEQGEQTVTRTFGGLGLGLSIVKSLADLHKASIAAVSEGKDKGATFTLEHGDGFAGERGGAVGAGELPCHMAGCAVLLVEDHRGYARGAAEASGEHRLQGGDGVRREGSHRGGGDAAVQRAAVGPGAAGWKRPGGDGASWPDRFGIKGIACQRFRAGRGHRAAAARRASRCI